MLSVTNLDTYNNSYRNEVAPDIENRIVSLEESPVETESRLTRFSRLIKLGCANCWECMAEFLSRSYEYLSELCASAKDWTNENLCCIQREQEDPLLKANVRRKKVTKKPVAVKMDPLKSSQVIKESSLVKECLPAKESSAVSEPSPVNSSSSSPVPALAQLNVPSTSSTSRSPLQLPTFNSLKTSPEKRETSPPVREPPKIRFQTTGSIFGDRKRSTIDHNMLQIENGRYRSPGLSKTIYGPGGRVIRVSFISGFPSFKSVESRCSASSIGSSNPAAKKSTETLQQNDKGTDPFSKKLMSIKSNKSLNSSSEGPRDEET